VSLSQQVAKTSSPERPGQVRGGISMGHFRCFDSPLCCNCINQLQQY
jgi:hypothetical protein